VNPNAALAAAYCQAYAEIQNVVKNKENPHFNSEYADLSAVLDTVRPVFAKYGLAVYQAPGKLTPLPDGAVAISVLSVLMHTSGAMMNVETQVPLGAKATAQAAGGAITYARRYALAAIAGIAQVDDDGNAASSAPRGGAADGAKVMAAIAAATSVGDEGTSEAGTLEALRDAVVATGDKDVVAAFQAKRKELRKGGKK
jgi:hypothetical protein